MQRKSHLSNRTQRRAAERAALKAARKNPAEVIAAETIKALRATASGYSQDSQAQDENPSASDIPTLDSSTREAIIVESPIISDTAYRSTGPQTPEGKQTSSRNAIRHGLCAFNTLILPTESLADYVQLESRWMETYRIDPSSPQTDAVKLELARTAARAEWFYLRAERNYSDTEAKLLTENCDMSTWTDDQHKQLSRVLRYRTANGNILGKHRKELEAHIKARSAETAFHQTSRHKDEKMAMARERLEVFRQKNKPFDLAEELEAMKQKAVRLGFRQPDPKPEVENRDGN